MTQVQTSRTYQTTQEFDYKHFIVPSNATYTVVEENSSAILLERDHTECTTKCVANLLEIDEDDLETYFEIQE